MDKTEVFNIAISFFNQPPREESRWDESDKLSKLCNLYVKRAEATVRREYPWSFLTKELSIIPEPEISQGAYRYNYPLPVDFLRMVKVENGNETYRLVGNRLLSNAEVLSIMYIPKDATSDDMTYESMVANRLALLLLPSQGGDGKLYNYLNADYARMKEELMRSEINARRDNIDNAQTSL